MTLSKKGSNYNFQKRVLKKKATCCGDDELATAPYYYYYTEFEIPLPGGVFFACDGTLLITAMTINGITYTINGGSGINMVGACRYNTDANTQMKAVLEANNVPSPGVHVGIAPFGVYMVLGMLYPNPDAVISFTYSWNNGVTFIGGPITLDNTVLYDEACYSTIIDVSGTTTPGGDATLADAAFSGQVMLTNAAPIGGGISFYNGSVCQRFNDPVYWANFEGFVQGNFGSQCSLTTTTLGPSLIQLDVFGLQANMLRTTNTPDYNVGIDFGCTGTYLPNPTYSWFLTAC
jgi:hypothetical protein